MTQPCQRGVNVDHEKSLGNYLYDGIDIYIYIYICVCVCVCVCVFVCVCVCVYYDDSQYKDIFFM